MYLDWRVNAPCQGAFPWVQVPDQTGSRENYDQGLKRELRAIPGTALHQPNCFSDNFASLQVNSGDWQPGIPHLEPTDAMPPFCNESLPSKHQ